MQYIWILLFCQIFYGNVHTDRLIDLGYEHDENTLFWPSSTFDGRFLLTVRAAGVSEGGYWYATNTFCAPEHGGTHMDAPYHFSRLGYKVDEIPMEHLIANAIVIDISEKAARDSNAVLTSADIEDWIETYGSIPNNTVVLINTGWAHKYGNASLYFGHPSDSQQFSFPGISQEACLTLIGLKDLDSTIVGVGLDTPSIDPGISKDFIAHTTLFDANIYGLENLRNIEKVPPVGAELIVMPMKIKGGTGGPARVIAKIQDELPSSATSNFCSFNIMLCMLSLLLYNYVF